MNLITFILVFIISIASSLIDKGYYGENSKHNNAEWIHKMVNYSTDEYMPPVKYKWDWSPATLMKGLVYYNESEMGKNSEKMIN